MLEVPVVVLVVTLLVPVVPLEAEVVLAVGEWPEVEAPVEDELAVALTLVLEVGCPTRLLLEQAAMSRAAMQPRIERMS